MVVQHNLQAMNASRMLGVTTSSQSKATEKLSSGYRINRAADDAAGLTISEKMRKQMRGLDRASTNAQDGVSAVQTAEGALTEVHAMLQRMNELAVQSANGTNAQTDRDAIQAEIDQLVTEIDRVAETTKFNETYLLKGDETKGQKTVYSYKTVTTPASVTYATGKAATDFYGAGQTGAYADEDALMADLAAGKKVYTDAATKVDQDAADKAAAGDGYTLTNATVTASNAGSFTAGTVDNGAVLTELGTKTSITYTWDDNNSYFTYTDKDGNAGTHTKGEMNTLTGGTVGTIADGDTITVTAPSVTHDDLYTLGSDTKMTDAEVLANVVKAAPDDMYKTPAEVTQTLAADGDVTYTPEKSELAKLYDKGGKEVAAHKIDDMLEAGDKLYADKDAATEVTEADLANYTTSAQVNAALELNLHVGADSTQNNKISINIDSMSAAGIGVNGLKVDTEDNATAAIDTIAAAIQQVSSQRSALGAVQNRLEHTIANLDNVVENTTAAESRIRDTDMADMMVEYSKNNILAQAGQSMLAQANQSTQGVLSLLQ